MPGLCGGGVFGSGVAAAALTTAGVIFCHLVNISALRPKSSNLGVRSGSIGGGAGAFSGVTEAGSLKK